ncbi:hypothetical protein HY572_06795 [Candidatus Micrarchaeota archaeon]|nr:hypothetical protein [Candidatus Micrarchaeota archaeon]
MATVSVFVPDDLKKKMDSREEVNWSGLLRNAIASEIDKLEFLEEVASKSKFTQKDAIELGRRLNAAIAKRHRSSP